MTRRLSLDRMILSLVGWSFFVGFVIVPAVLPAFSAVMSSDAWTQVASDRWRLINRLAMTSAIIACVNLLAIPTSLALGWSVLNLPSQGMLRRFVQAFLTAWMVMPIVLVAGGYRSFVGPQGLLIGGLQDALSARLLAVTVIHSLWILPMLTLVFAGEMSARLGAIDELAFAEVGRWRLLLRSMLPRLVGTIGFATLITGLSVWLEMSVTDLFAIRTMAEEVYIQFEMGAGERATLLATFLTSLPIACLVAFSLLHVLKELKRASSFNLTSVHATPISIVGSVMVGVLLLLLPTLGNVWQLGLAYDPEALRDRFSIPLAISTLKGEALALMPILGGSFFWSSIAGLVATTGGLLLGWIYLRAGFVRRSIIVTGMSLCLTIPGPVLAVNLVGIFNQPGVLGEIYDSPMIVVYGLICRLFPVCWAIVMFGLMRMPANAVTNRELDTGRESRLLFGVALPYLRKELLFSLVVSCCWGMGELATTKILLPPGYDSVSLRLFHLLHTGTGNEPAALGLILQLSMLGLMIFLFIVRRWLR